MADPRFFSQQDPVALSEIAQLTGAEILRAGGEPATAEDAARQFECVAPLDRAGATDISFLDNTKYIDSFARSEAGACLVRPKFAARAPEGMLLLVTEEPYYCYALVAQRFFAPTSVEPGISEHAHIHETATLGEGCRVEAGAWIGENVIIGARCHIGVNAVIHAGVTLGDDCHVGANSTLSHCVIANRVHLHRGVHIGQDGFGFAGSRRGIAKVPQLGRVLIEDDVEIGSGTCIDRGTGPDTVIGAQSKIDNLVQIGHNVQIGRFVMIAAQTGIAGSTSVGDGAMLGGQTGLSGHLRIGAGAKIAAQSGVMSDIPPGAAFGGAPALPIKDWHRQTVAISRLSKKREADND